MKRSFALVLTFFTILTGVMVFTKSAEAFPAGGVFGRSEYRGYFTNSYATSGHRVFPNGIPTTINSADEFINFIWNKHQNGNTQERTGAAFIIQTMRGQNGNGSLRPVSAAEYNDWAARVRSRAQAGRISWNVNYSYTVNSFYQNSNDDAFYDDTGTLSSIVFYNDNGAVVYALKHLCANPVGRGNPPGLPKAWALSGSSAVSAGTARPGQTVTFTHSIRNDGPGSVLTNGFQWKVQRYKNTTLVTDPALAGGSAQNAGISRQYGTNNFVIPNDAPNGTKYCQRIYYVPKASDDPGADASTTVCVTVVTAGGDVCPNIPGVQATVPPGKVVDASGNCVDPPSGSCFSPPTRSITLPANGVPASDSVPAYGPSGATYHTYTANGYYKIDSAKDEWADPTAFSPSGRNPNPFTLDYSSYVTNYPYDYHTPIVGYTTYYTDQKYTATGPEGFSYSDNNGDGDTTDPGEQTSLGFAVVAAGSSERSAPNGSYTAPTMAPCYDRTFDLTPTIVSAAFDDLEDPTTATFKTHIDAVFDEANVHKNLQQAFKVNFNVTTIYRVYHLDGSSNPYPASLSRIAGSTSSSPAAQCAPYSGFSSATSINGNKGPTDTVRCDYQDVFQAKLPPLRWGDKICLSKITVAPAVGRMKPDGTPTSISVANRSSSDGDEGNCSERIQNRPYMRSFGGDTSAGAGFATIDASNNEVCTANASATFIGYETSSTTSLSRQGAGNQLGVYAAAQIEEYASAILRPAGGIGSPPKGLTFANTGGGGGSSTYGGGLDTNNFGCAADYYGSKPTSSPALPSGSVINGRVLNPREQQVVYVNGDAFITGDIRYANSGAYVNANFIPSFYLVAKGNIYIRHDVGRLDGTFIAQPTDSNGDGVADSGTGRVYTCATDAGTLPDAAQLISTCNTKLSINGSVIAQLIKPLRTNGTLRDATDYESYNAANLAESILFGPEVWLNPGIPTSRSAARGVYDAITALPPIL